MLRLDLQNQQTISLLTSKKITLNIRKDKFDYRSYWGNNKSSVVSIKKFELHGNELTHTEFLNVKHGEIHHFHRNQCYGANKCEIFESNCDL